MKSKLLIVVAAVATLAVPMLSATASGTNDKAGPVHKVHLCHGHRPSISRGPGANDIVGTRHRDIIYAGRGSDRVLGRGGNDLICGGPGRDMLDGNRGLDTIYGGRGSDWCVAWRHREHRLYHHQCEIHMSPTGHHRPHKAPPSAVRHYARPTTLPAKPAALSVKQLAAGGSCTGGTYPCSPGIPQCDGLSQTVSYETQRTVDPSVVTSGGYIAVLETFQVPDAAGNPVAIYGSPSWTTYQLDAGNWFVPPTPQTFSIDYSFGFGNGTSGVAVTWFSYSADGINWSGAEYAISTQYIQQGFGGYGNVDSNECNV